MSRPLDVSMFLTRQNQTQCWGFDWLRSGSSRCLGFDRNSLAAALYLLSEKNNETAKLEGH